MKNQLNSRSFLSVSFVLFLCFLIPISPANAQEHQNQNPPNRASEPRETEDDDGETAVSGTETTESDRRLPGLVVTGTRTEESLWNIPPFVSRVSEAYMEKTQSRSMRDVSRILPGVEVNNGAPRRLGERMNIRGLVQDQIIIRRDGARVAPFRSGHKGNQFFDLGNVKSVEVLKGPSALYGSGGLGGVVRLETYDPSDFLGEDDLFGGQFQASYSDAFGEVTTGTRFYGQSLEGSLRYLVNLTTRNADDEVDLASPFPGDPDTLQLAEENIVNPTGTFVYEPNEKDRFELSLEQYRNKGRTVSNLDMVGVSPDDNAVVNRVTTDRSIQVQYERNGTPWWQNNIKSTLYWNGMEIDEDRVENGSADSGTGDRISFDTYGLDIQNSFTVPDHSFPGTHTLTYGLEITRDDEESSTTRDPGGNANAFFPDAGQTKSGLFLQDDIRLWEDDLQIIPGVRVDHWANDPDDGSLEDRSETEASFQIGTRYNVTDDIKITANYSEGFRAPSIQELYNEGVHFQFPVGPNTFTEFFEPNPDLEPETSQNIDVGLRYVTDHLKARASYYHIDADDFIASVLLDDFSFVPPVDGTRSRQNQNVASAELFGVEASAEWTLTERWSVSASYANPHGINETEGIPLSSIPAENLVLGTEWEPLDNWSTGLFGRIYDDRDNTPDGVEAPGYTLYDAYVQWTPSPSLRLNLSANNLSDKAYTNAASGRPGTGRDIRFGFRWKFPF